MKRNFFVGLMLASLSGAGCTGASQDAPAPPPPPVVTGTSSPVVPEESLDEDTLAEQAYARMQGAFAAKQADGVRFTVYALQPVGEPAARVRERARLLGMEQALVNQSASEASLVAGSRELRVDARSGAERYVDHARFHTGQGVTALPLSQSRYIANARGHVQRMLPEVAARELRPYKVRRYLNDSAGPGGVRSGARVYQVAVAFHELLDGLPIIGPGGKVAVHLSPEGEVISHESTARAVSERREVVSGAALLAPDEARRQVEARLEAQGVKLSDYTLSRAELGYFRLGRNSVQSVLVPHYAYLYEPRSAEVLGKKRAEFIPAVTDPGLLAVLREDEQAEAERKSERKANAAEPDRK